MDIEKILREIDFSKTSLIKEPLWEKISEQRKKDSPAELSCASLSHGMMCEEMREGILELADDTLDEIAAAGLILHEELSPKTDGDETR